MLVPRWLLLPGLALASLVLAGDPEAPVPAAPALSLAPERGTACPLTPSEERTAVVAFEEMMPVVRHPRCNNCHGGIDPLVPYKQGGHMGDIDTSTIAHNSVQTRRHVCQECHSELEGWDTPGEPMLWNGKTTKQICMQFKAFSTDPADFIGHITNEHGGVQFIETAFKGEKGLNDASKDISMDHFKIPFKVDPPPGTHQDLIRQGTEWANAVGTKGWTATPECGCEIRRNGWIGSATATMRMDGAQYSVEEKAFATVFFEFDADLSQGADQQYWKSTAGAISWEVTFSGQCVGHYTGTTPMVQGGDVDPIARIQLSPEAGGGLRYSASVGPWEDRYYPVTSVPCKDAPPLVTVLPRFVGDFWRHAPTGGLVTMNGTSITGDFSLKMPEAEQRWIWSFRKTTARSP